MSTNLSVIDLDRNLQPPLYAKRGLALVRGEGAYLYDSDGNKYLDMMSNYGVAILGHAHPKHTAAIQHQAATLISCHQSFANDQRSEFLQTLAGMLPDQLESIFLSNSGTEAVEAALKFAWVSTGKSKLVATKRAYHGRTMGALSATGEKKYRDPFAGSLAQAEHVTFGDLEALDATVDDDTAAIVLEPIQGEGGIHVAPPGYLASVKEIAQQRGARLVFDEIQTGFRTGKLAACEHDHVTPDILVLAKGLAAGVPIGATAVTKEIAESLGGGVHGTTFGGNPLASAAGLATLNAINDEDLFTKSAEVGDYLLQRLNALQHPKIRDIRGRGMMIGIELKGRVTPVLKGLQENGVLALPAGNLVLRFLPPLILTKEQADTAVDTLASVLG
ncbi:MAG: aspartate aminotransferase family protein [Sphaerobacteraceae bacterium]|nr:MAG: aspartate aminotransferase family protein [Sphaerobacteraceae bacterium]